jgi:hypothetical protein
MIIHNSSTTSLSVTRKKQSVHEGFVALWSCKRETKDDKRFASKIFDRQTAEGQQKLWGTKAGIP